MTTTDVATLCDTALRYQAIGINVIANKPGTKEPCHIWKGGTYKRGQRAGQCGPDWTKQRQTRDDVTRLPWHNAGALGLVSGIGGVRVFDFDKCPDPAPVKAALAAMELPDDYAWQGRSGSHNGYTLVVICDELPPGLFDQTGILIGSPRQPGDFHQLELRAWGCQTLVAPSLHKSGKRYEWLYGQPSASPARISADQLMAGFLAVAELPRRETPEPRPIERKITPGEQAAENMALAECYAAARAWLIAHYDLVTELESAGAKKTNNNYSCPFCQHKNTTTLTIASGGKAGYSHSKNCKLASRKGFDVTNVLIVRGNYRGFDDMARALAPHCFPKPQPSASAPEYLTTAAAERRQKDAQRKRAARKQAAADLRAEIEARAGTDDTLTPCDRAVLEALLKCADARGWCRPSKERLAEMSGYSLGSVKRALATDGRLERRYITSEGDGGGPNQTAIRTFVRGSSFATETIKRPDDDPRIYIKRDPIGIPDHACERGGVPLGEPDSPDTWEWCEDDHGADELNALDTHPSQAPLSPEPVTCGDVRTLLSWVRAAAREVAEPAWYLRDYADWPEADLRVEYDRLMALADMAPAPSEEAAEITAGLAPAQDPEISAFQWAPEGREAALVLADGLLQTDEPEAPGASYDAGLDITDRQEKQPDDPRAVPSWLRNAGDIAMEPRPGERVEQGELFAPAPAPGVPSIRPARAAQILDMPPALRGWAPKHAAQARKARDALAALTAPRSQAPASDSPRPPALSDQPASGVCPRPADMIARLKQRSAGPL